MDVLLLRDLRSERRRSMDRYADELEAALNRVSGVRARSWAPEESGSGLGWPWDRVANYRRRFVDYPRRVRHLQADVYHVIDHAYAHLLAGLPAERTVVTCHDLTLPTSREWAGYTSRRPAAFMLQWSLSFLRRAAHVVAVSNATREDLLARRLVQQDRVSVIANGLSAEFWAPSAAAGQSLRSRLAGDHPACLILHVGTSLSHKNVRGAIACVAELRGRGVPAWLVCAGAPLTGSLLAFAARLGMGEFITEIGQPDEAGLGAVYGAADLLVHPSLKEGFGWPPLEAMACGLPVVTSLDSALVEVTAEAALHAPARDAGALADACQRLISDRELRERLRAEGLARSRSFRWESTATAMVSLYRRVAGIGSPQAMVAL